MFLLETKTIFLEALRSVFNEDYPVADFRAIWTGMEYPEDRSAYPGIWVDFEPTSPLQSAGIGHVEYTVNGDTGQVRKGSRWRFGGNATFTVQALTSLERDRLADELIKVMAFGLEDPNTAAFRHQLEINDLIALSVQWDTFTLTGKDESPGTPWGTPEIVYEITVSVDVEGSFVSDASHQSLISLTKVSIIEFDPSETPPPDSGGWI